MDYFLSSYLKSCFNFGYESRVCQEQIFLAYDISSGWQGKCERKETNDLRDEQDFLSQLTETVHMFIMFKLFGN